MRLRPGCGIKGQQRRVVHDTFLVAHRVKSML
jgi:hypothetical protein